MKSHAFVGLLMFLFLVLDFGAPQCPVASPYLTEAVVARSVPNPIVKFQIDGESESGDFLKVSHLGGRMRFRGEDTDLVPWKHQFLDGYNSSLMLLANVTENNFMIVFLYLFNGSNIFQYNRFDYRSGTIDRAIFSGRQYITNQEVLTPSFLMPRLSIPLNLKVTSPYSVLSKTMYLTGSRGFIMDGNRQLDLIPIFRQGANAREVWKEVWTIATDNQGEYYFTIYYFFDSDRSHFARGHNMRLNDFRQAPIETIECYRNEGSFPSTLAVSMPNPASSVKIDGFEFKTDERGTIEVGLPSGEHTVTVPDVLQQDKNTRVCFSRWRYQDLGNPAKIGLSHFLQLTAEYGVEHYLRIESSYGQVTRSGWYSEGRIAVITANPVVEYGNDTRHLFVGWEGDISSNLSNCSIVMDAPKTIRAVWRKQYRVSISPRGLPPGASTTISINGAQFSGAIPFVHSTWLDKGSIALFSVSPINVTSSSKSYVFEKWLSDLRDPENPSVRIDGPTSLIAKYRPSIRSSINLASQTSLFGDSVTLNGRLTPAPHAASVELWSSTDGFSWIKISDITAQSDGTFTSTFKTQVRGKLFFKASWIGDEEYAGSESPHVVLIVQNEFPWQSSLTLPGILQYLSAIEKTSPLTGAIVYPVRSIVTLSMKLSEWIHVGGWVRDIAGYLFASGITGLLYLTIPLVLAIAVFKRIRGRIPSIFSVKPLIAQLGVGLILVIVAQTFVIPILTAAGLLIMATAFVMLTPAMLAIITARLLMRNS